VTQIEAREVRAVLVDACAALAAPLAEDDGDDERLTYLEIATIVRWLAAQVKGQDESCFPAIFQAAERCLAEGTTDARTLIAVGLFEDLQNDNLTGGVEWAVWERHLAPLSRAAWDAVAEFWAGDVAAPTRLFDRHGWGKPK
jgi:hypothetical protein